MIINAYIVNIGPRVNTIKTKNPENQPVLLYSKDDFIRTTFQSGDGLYNCRYLLARLGFYNIC